MKIFITGISYYLPNKVLDNAALSQLHPEWSVEKITAKTGIAERRIAAEDEFSSDMGIKAAEKLFKEFEIKKESVDFLLFCTQSPDYFLPTTACILQEKIGLNKNIGALDFNLGCSGFVYGIGLAKGLIATGQAKNVLLITSETYSKFIHPDDKSNKTLFGDAAAATFITSQPSGMGAEIQDFAYGTDGSGAEYLIVRNGGMRKKGVKGADVFNEGGFERNDDYLYMDGKAIFNFTAFQIPGLINQTLKRNNLVMDEIDQFIFHQANEFMLHTVRKRAKIPEEKFIIDMANCGNTVSSTIPIALIHTINNHKIKKGNKVLIAGFGVGLSMGATVLQF